MYCPKCGKKVNEKDVFCKYCGEKIDAEKEEVKEAEVTEVVKETTPVEEKNSLRTASIVLGIIALVGNLFIIFSFISVLLAAIGLILAICATKKGRNVAGIVLNVISLVLSILLISIMIRIVRLIPRVISGGLNAGSDIIEKYSGEYGFNDIIEGFNSGDFDINDIIKGFTNGDFNIEDFDEDFNIEEFTRKYRNEEKNSETF